MNTNINPNRVPIEWTEFLSLCVSCGLTKRALANGKYSFWYGNIGVIHQAKGQDGGQFKNQGYFNGVYGNFGDMWRGLPVTKDGQVRVIETINPEAPMTKDSQSAFDEVVRFIVDKRSKQARMVVYSNGYF